MAPHAPSAPRGAINVGSRERAASVLFGAGLLVRALFHPLRRLPSAAIGGALLHRGVTGHCHGYAALGIDTARGESEPATVDLVQSVTIGKSADELYRLWTQPGTLERALGDFVEIRNEEDGRTVWRFGAGEHGVEYATHIAFEQRPEMIRWESAGDAERKLQGSLHLTPATADRGTEVTLHLAFEPPGGRIGRALLKLLGPAPQLLVGKALRRFKSLAETGEIPTLERNPAARAGGHAALETP